MVWASLLSAQNQVGNTLIGDAAGERLGHAVAVTPDGNTMAVATSVGLSQGQVAVYDLVNGTWTQRGQTLSDPSGASALSSYGFDVELSANGQFLFVSDPQINAQPAAPGRVHIYIYFGFLSA